MPKTAQKAKKPVKMLLMTFGLGGNAGYLDSGTRTQWYVKPEEFQQIIDSGHYDEYDLDGCLLLDKCPAVERDPGLAIRSPMPDATLPPGTVNPFDKSLLDDPVTKLMMAEFARGGGAAAVASAHIGGFDTVAPDVYVNWWTQRGARTGRIEGRRVIWDNPEE